MKSSRCEWVADANCRWLTPIGGPGWSNSAIGRPLRLNRGHGNGRFRRNSVGAVRDPQGPLRRHERSFSVRAEPEPAPVHLRFRGALQAPTLRVTSSAQGCGRRTYTSRSRLRSFNRCAARDWRPEPRDRRGVERLPLRSGATSSGASSAAFKTGGRPTTVSPRRIEDLARVYFQRQRL